MCRLTLHNASDLPQLAGNNAVEVMTATESADFLAADMTDDILPLAAEHAQCEIYSFTQPVRVPR